MSKLCHMRRIQRQMQMSTRFRWRRLSSTRYLPPTSSYLPPLVCDSLASGPNRHTRPSDQQQCQCTEGWTGINCNLCQTDDACGPLMPKEMNGTCYKGGLTVKENYQ